LFEVANPPRHTIQECFRSNALQWRLHLGWKYEHLQRANNVFGLVFALCSVIADLRIRGFPTGLSPAILAMNSSQPSLRSIEDSKKLGYSAYTFTRVGETVFALCYFRYGFAQKAPLKTNGCKLHFNAMTRTKHCLRSSTLRGTRPKIVSGPLHYNSAYI
jgi:hypothetical protein